ncbi:DNA primase [Tatumella morbirosei]|uniref:DNA primase n=1 Tax=Tatumella morbirosei TaxID=642227 RepID=A0A095UZJ1_9GAMM|nr:primase-helicase zinc-binding domain-containing protein [Tatumella morbirosei]KGD79698.1 DNA primase [Tatumella morbirosei]
MRNIDLIREVTTAAAGNWPYVMAGLAVSVPQSPRQHSSCPACGGKDRFRFDDNGRGSFICNQCGAGDGLDLIRKVHQCDTTEAAKLVADVLGIDYRTAETDPKSAGQRRDQLEQQRQSQAEEYRQRQDETEEERRAQFDARYQRLEKTITDSESEYLVTKGLREVITRCLPDGSILLPLTDAEGNITAAQTISKIGSKKLVAGSAKKGAYHAVNAPQKPQAVILAEGYATALSVSLMRPEALAVAAIDAGNLLPVAKVMRGKYPQAKIIIAADNDYHDDEPNTGKLAAIKAAQAVSGWVTLPPGDHKADWDDYRQQYGLEKATAAFNQGLYQPEGGAMTAQLQVISGGKETGRKTGGDIARMPANQKARLLSQRWDELAVNPESQAVYQYQSGAWEKLPDSVIEREMVQIFEEFEADYTEKGIKSVVATMKLQLDAIGEARNDLIGFENGVYDLKTQQFSPHSPGNWLMNHNGITYTEPGEAENIVTHAPSFTKWLTHATAGNARKAERIKAALFMVLANRSDWQLFIEVTGEGGSGKSVFSGIATTLAGEHNTASGSMMTLDTPRGRAQLIGKSLILMPDQTRYVGEGSGIKAITGGDAVEIDGKYEKQFSTVINAVVLATNNEPMTFTERNGGIARRRVIFPFNIPVSDADKDPELAAKIRREIPVVIRHLLAIFADQDKAKRLLIEQRESQEAMSVKCHTDPLYGFCGHIIALGEAVGMFMGNLNISPRAPRIYLYHAYLAYMDAHGFERPLTLTRFGSDFPKVMKEYGAEYKKAKTKAGIRYNMELAESADDWLPAVPRLKDDPEYP